MLHTSAQLEVEISKWVYIFYSHQCDRIVSEKNLEKVWKTRVRKLNSGCPSGITTFLFKYFRYSLVRNLFLNGPSRSTLSTWLSVVLNDNKYWPNNKAIWSHCLCGLAPMTSMFSLVREHSLTLLREVSLYDWPPVWLVLDSTNLVNLYLIQHKQSSWILTSQTGGQLYSETSPYKVLSGLVFPHPNRNALMY